MQKEEFPTFLNEQPTIIFGRTGRELMIMAIGLTLAYVCWQRLGSFGLGAGDLVIKIVLAALSIIIAATVALTKVAGRPMEEWAFTVLFYFLTPKVYVYMPKEESEEDIDDEDEEDEEAQKQLVAQQAADDDY